MKYYQTINTLLHTKVYKVPYLSESVDKEVGVISGDLEDANLTHLSLFSPKMAGDGTLFTLGTTKKVYK
jgi:hypothetical protein